MLQAGDRGKLTPLEKDALISLSKHLEEHPGELPKNLKMYRSLLGKAHSSEYALLVRRVASPLVGAGFEALMDFAAFQDFSLRHERWGARYQAALEDLYGLLLVLEHEPFFRQLSRVLHGPMTTEAKIKAADAKFRAKLRQRECRAKQSKAPKTGSKSVAASKKP